VTTTAVFVKMSLPNLSEKVFFLEVFSEINLNVSLTVKITLKMKDEKLH